MTTLASLLATLALATGPAARGDTTAEEFSDYVTRMVRVSHRFARAKADFQEREIFLNVLSRSQESLSTASVALAEARDAAATIAWLESDTADAPPCPDSASIFRTLRTIGSIQRKLRDSRHRISEYRARRSGLERACEHGFEETRFTDSDISIVIPEIELADGVQISIGSDLIKMGIDALVSFVNMIFNGEEQESIEQSAQRFRDRCAKTEDMRSYAAGSCAAERALVAPIYESFDTYAAKAEALAARLAAAPWDRLEKRLLGCLQESEDAVVTAGIREAVLTEARRSRSEWSDVRRLIAAIRLRGRVTRKESALASAPCGTGAELARSLRSESTLVALWGLPAQDAVARVAEILSNRTTRCGDRE